ncbi:MAG: histidinol-phosphate transaminase [Bacillota bacterium]
MIDWEGLARPNIFRIPPYVPGKPIEEVERELGLTGVVKLASNENPLGPSPKALAALKDELPKVSFYPDAGAVLLREALALRLGVTPEEIIVGNGSDEVIRLAAEALLGPGDEAVICAPTFGEYLYAVRLLGAEPVIVRHDRGQNLAAMLAAVTPRTKIVFLCNPNNPTGTMVKKEEFEEFLAGLPPGVLIVYDAAYREYVDAPDYPEPLEYLRAGAPILALRTFSKIYGLAGLRVGYGIGPRGLISLLYRVKEPFNVNLLAQKAALAALNDEDHLRRSREMNAAGREQLYRGLAALGLRWLPSQANFVLVDLGREARPVYEGLLRQGVIVRPADVFGLPHCLRVTVGTPTQNERFLRALASVLGVSGREGTEAIDREKKSGEVSYGS